MLVGAGELRERPDGTFVPRRADEFPAAAVSLRSAGRDAVAIVDADTGEVIGDVDAGRAPSTVHQGAIYLHGGRQFEVSALHWTTARARARVRRRLVHAAQARDRHADRAGARVPRTALGVRLSFGTVVVTEQVLGLPAPAARRPRGDRPDPAGPAADVVRDAGALVRARPSPTSGRCTPPSTPRSPCCRCWRCATAGTSAGSRPTATRRPAARRSSSTTATRAGSGSRAAATRRSSGWSRRLPARVRVPVRVGLPVVRAVAQVRQPQRAALEGRRDRAHGRDAAHAVRSGAGRSASRPSWPTSR